MNYTPLTMKIGAGFLIAAAIAWYVWHISTRPAVFEVYVFNVPGAPSIFMRTEDDRRILVHGGSNSDIVRRVTELLPFYSRRIDTIVALDDDPKHITGLIEMLGRYDVGSVVLGVATSSDPTFGVFVQRIADIGLAPSSIQAGDSIAGTSLVIVDMKRGVFAFRAGGKSVLIVPFSLSTLSKKLFDAVHPDYIIYSAALSTKSEKAKPKADLLAGIMSDHRFNIRSTGGVRVSIKKAPFGADLSIEEI